MGRILVLGVLLAALGCASPNQPEPVEGRNTPLNEEVDEVEKVRG